MLLFCDKTCAINFNTNMASFEALKQIYVLARQFDLIVRENYCESVFILLRLYYYKLSFFKSTLKCEHVV